jgi:hypothetical protein
MASDISSGRSAPRSMPPSRLFELLLRIKESVGDEVFEDALVINRATSHHPTPAGGAEKEELGLLPWTFICKYQHKHAVRDVGDIKARCLLERIALEWAARC